MAPPPLLPGGCETLRYLRLTGPAGQLVDLVEALHPRSRACSATDDMADPTFSELVELDLSDHFSPAWPGLAVTGSSDAE